MRFEDPVYGDQKIEETVLLELIASEPLQRLKRVNQAGPQRYFGYENKRVTRFEHSLGVTLLLRQHGAPLKEQIAGLLHDVSHAAFSHLVDFVFEHEDHEYHEDVLEDIVYDSRIPEILDEHGFETREILDDSNFPLLERDIPELCADRIDYFLRDVKTVGGEDVSHFLSSIDVRDDEFVLTEVEIAEEYTLRYIQADQEWWANPKEIALFEIFADAIRYALENGVLEEGDLFEDDEHVYNALRSSEHEEIQERLDILEGFEIEFEDEDYDFYLEPKARYVDPKVDLGNDVVRVSEVSDEAEERIEEHRDRVNDGFRVSIS